MNCNDYREHLADLISGEALPSVLAAAREHEATCAACAKETASLRVALRAAESLTAGPATYAFTRPAPVRATRWASFARLAAAIALAFGLGYFARGTSPAAPTPADPAANTKLAATSAQQRFIDAARETPEASSLAWALVAVAKR